MVTQNWTKSDIDFNRRLIRVMSVLYKILYNGTPLVVNPTTFARFSPIFAQYYDPSHGGEMKITSEIPVSNFEEFLPAVQGGHCTITEQNLDSLRSLAQQWGVPDLIDECAKWEHSPAVIVSRFVAAIDAKDRGSIDDFISLVAPRIDEFLSAEPFAQVPAKFLAAVLSHPKCAPVDSHRLVRFLLAVLNAQLVPRASALFNDLDVTTLTPDEIELVITHDRIDLSVIASFLSNCAQGLLKAEQSAADKLAKLDGAIHRIEKQCQDITADTTAVRKQIDDERRRHDDHKRQLQAMLQRYEPNGPPERREEKQGKTARWKGQQAAKSQFVYIPADDPKRPHVTIEDAKPKAEDDQRRPPPQRTKKHDRFTYTPGVDD